MLLLMQKSVWILLTLTSSFAALCSSHALAGVKSTENSMYSVRRDIRRCAAPACGGWWVAPVNTAASSLLNESLLAIQDAPHTGSAPAYVADLEFSCAHWTPQQINTFSALAERGVALIYGQLSPSRSVDSSLNDGQEPQNTYRTLVVRDAFTSANSNAPKGIFYTVKSTGIMCTLAPCPTDQADMINTKTSQKIHALDFDKTFTPEQLAQAQLDLDASGFVASGTQHLFNAEAGEGVRLEINQIFWPFPAAAQ
jgi:hypothetical protein